MNRRTISRALLLAPLASLLASCGPREAAVSEAEYRPPLGANTVAAAYFTIESPVADRITEVSSPLARAVEMHASVNAGGVMRMQRLETLDLPAGEAIIFQPGGMHLMIFDPEQVSAEKTFPITFVLESGRNLSVPFRVWVPPGAGPGQVDG